MRLGLAMLAAVPLLALAAAGTGAQDTFTYLNGLAPAA